MSLGNNQFLFWFGGIILLLGYYASLCYQNKGEVLASLRGEVQHCNVLNQGREDPVTHATIRTQRGDYIIAPLSGCQDRATVTVSVTRGALFFNRVNTASSTHPDNALK